MDRRGLLRFMGVSAASAIVAPKLLLPAVRQIAVPDPQRRVFLPPANGWAGMPPSLGDFGSGSARFSWRTDRAALDYINRFTRAEARYDIDVYGDLPVPVQPGDTVNVVIDRLGDQQMVVTEIDCWPMMGRWRLRGMSPSPFMSSAVVGSIKPDRASVTRSLIQDPLVRFGLA